MALTALRGVNSSQLRLSQRVSFHRRQQISLGGLRRKEVQGKGCRLVLGDGLENGVDTTPSPTLRLPIRSCESFGHPPDTEYEDGAHEASQPHRDSADSGSSHPERRVGVGKDELLTRVLCGFLRTNCADDCQHGNDRDDHSKTTC